MNQNIRYKKVRKNRDIVVGRPERIYTERFDLDPVKGGEGREAGIGDVSLRFETDDTSVISGVKVVSGVDERTDAS